MAFRAFLQGYQDFIARKQATCPKCQDCEAMKLKGVHGRCLLEKRLLALVHEGFGILSKNIFSPLDKARSLNSLLPAHCPTHANLTNHTRCISLPKSCACCLQPARPDKSEAFQCPRTALLRNPLASDLPASPRRLTASYGRGAANAWRPPPASRTRCLVSGPSQVDYGT